MKVEFTTGEQRNLLAKSEDFVHFDRLAEEMWIQQKETKLMGDYLYKLSNVNSKGEDDPVYHSTFGVLRAWEVK